MLRQTSMKKIDPKTPPLSPSQKELPKEGFRSFLFQQYSIEDISIAITYLMFQVFKLIAPSELHDGAWQVCNFIHLKKNSFNKSSFSIGKMEETINLIWVELGGKAKDNSTQSSCP